MSPAAGLFRVPCPASHLSPLPEDMCARCDAAARGSRARPRPLAPDPARPWTSRPRAPPALSPTRVLRSQEAVGVRRDSSGSTYEWTRGSRRAEVLCLAWGERGGGPRPRVWARQKGGPLRVRGTLAGRSRGTLAAVSVFVGCSTHVCSTWPPPVPPEALQHPRPALVGWPPGSARDVLNGARRI